MNLPAVLFIVIKLHLLNAETTDTSDYARIKSVESNYFSTITLSSTSFLMPKTSQNYDTTKSQTKTEAITNQSTATFSTTSNAQMKTDATTSQSTITMLSTTYMIRDTTLILKVYSTLNELAIDGIDQKYNNNNWDGNIHISVPEYSRLFTFVASVPNTTVTCAGILASLYKKMETSSQNCKCTNTPKNGYSLLGYDDSDWPVAVEYGNNNGSVTNSICGDLPAASNISPNAQWIWADFSPSIPERVISYCRCYSNICTNGNNPCLNGGICNQNSPKLCTCFGRWKGRFCENENMANLSMTAKEKLERLYLDGAAIRPLEEADQWEKAMSIEVSAFTKLIAVAVSNFDNACSGFLASFDDLIVTNSSWKCTPTNYLNWFSADYDDSSWSKAVVVGNNTKGLFNCPSYSVGGISKTAQWIWTNDSPGTNSLVYCRGYLPACLTNPCVNGGKCNTKIGDLCTCLTGFSGPYCETVTPLVLTITALTNLDALFIDGLQQSLRHPATYNQVESIEIHPLTRLVAVYSQAVASKNSSCHGLIAEIRVKGGDDLYKSDQTWTCSDYANNGWYDLGYSGTWSKYTTTLGFNGNLNNCPVDYIQAISNTSQYIWNSRSNLVNLCRYELRLCDHTPCQNGGTCQQNSQFICTCKSGFIGKFCEKNNYESTARSSVAVYNVDTVNVSFDECGKFGQLVRTESTIACQCLSGILTKNKCLQTIEHCRPDSCNRRGRCVKRDFGIVCLCDVQYSGNYCEIKKQL